MNRIDWRDHCPVFVGGVLLGHARVTLETVTEPETTDGLSDRVPRRRRLVADVAPSSSDPGAPDDGFRVLEGEDGVVFVGGGS